MTTILGHNISIIRPRNIAPFGVRRCDKPVGKYDTRPKTRKLGVAEFLRLCMKYNKKYGGEEEKDGR